MINTLSKRILVAGLALLTTNAKAENLIDVFRLAIERDPQLLAAQADHQAQIQVKQQAVGALLPRITLNGGAARTTRDITSDSIDYDVFDVSTGQSFPTSFVTRWDISGKNTYNSNYLTLQVYQPLLDMGVIADYMKAGHTVLRADLDYRLAQQDIIMRVAERYLQVLLDGSTLNLARAEKNAIANQHEASKHKYELGLIAVTDVHEVKARLDHAIAQEIQAENALAAAREDLREITGVLHNNLLVIKADAPLIPPSPSNIDAWTSAAVSQNLRVRAAEHQLEAAQMAVNHERAAYFPTIGLMANYGKNAGMSNSPQGGTFGNSTVESIVAIDVSLNVFQGGITHSRIQQAKFQVDKAQQELEGARRAASKLTRNAFLSVLAGISHVTALRQAVISSEAAHRSSIAGFDVGARTSIEVLNAQQELYRSQREFAAARIDYILNTLRLKLNIGMLTVDDLEQINSWLG